VPILPVITLAARFRHLLTNEQPMISKTLADGKVAVEAIKVFAGDVSQLIDLVSGLFGEHQMVGGVNISDDPIDQMTDQAAWEPSSSAGPVGFRERHLIRRVKMIAQAEAIQNGVAWQSQDGSEFVKTTSSSFDIEAIWPKAVSFGAEQLVLEHLSAVEGFRELVAPTGKIMDWLKSLAAWAYAHKDQLLAIAKVLLTFLMALGLI
jgi:hypothetical protein